MDNETKLLEGLKKASASSPFLDKDNTLVIHYGDGTWINKQLIIEELNKLNEAILKYRDLYVIDQLIEKIKKL